MSTKITIELIVPDDRNIHSESVRDILRQALLTRRQEFAAAELRVPKRQLNKVLKVIDRLTKAFDKTPLIKVEKCTEAEEDE